MIRSSLLLFAVSVGFGQTAAELEAHVRFLALDALEGRGNGSPGLEVAAEYLAAQFQLAGLKPLNGSYFQPAEMLITRRRDEDWVLRLDRGVESVHLAAADVVPLSLPLDEKIEGPVYKASSNSLAALSRETIEGKAVITDAAPSVRGGQQLLDLGAIAAIFVPAVALPAQRARARLQPAGTKPGLILALRSEGARQFYSSLPEGLTETTLRLKCKVDVQRMTLRNVAGILPGSSPEVRDTYVIASAHYDHLGKVERDQPDKIYNGANDNASGTAAVIAIARELASRKERPRRSVLFLGFFGEESGLVGSRYYAANPLVPLENTIAQVNLEQLGRTDDSEGPRISSAFITGYDYSSVVPILADAAKPTGLDYVHHPRFSDLFFGQSDNEPIALRGIPAHTVGVSFLFPDYHQPGDEAGKLDYSNFALVARGIAAGIVALADAAEAPRWNEANPKTAPYRSR